MALVVLVAALFLLPLPIASWLLKRRVRTSSRELSPAREKLLKFGVSLGFICCASVLGLFLLSQLWDPPAAGSVEAPNTVLCVLALLGNACNLIAMGFNLASWNYDGFVGFLLLGINQVLWLLLLGEILIAHGF